MANTNENNQGLVEFLDEISKRVEKWPEWKRDGWAILDRKDESDVKCTPIRNGASAESEVNGIFAERDRYLS